MVDYGHAALSGSGAVRVRAVWNVRLWRTSAYVPFYSGENLATILGTRYEYHPEFAPTTEILTGYKNSRITWADYEKLYRELLAARRPADGLAAEYIASQFSDIEIIHL